MRKREKSAAETRRENRGNVPGHLGMAELAALTDLPDVASEPRKPQWVVCKQCDHKWIGLYLPMPISDAAKAMGKLCCPMCAAGSNKITITQPVKS